MPKNLNGQQSSGNYDWETPEDLMRVLEAEFGKFDLDPCATYKSRKAWYWFGAGSWRCSGGGTYSHDASDSHPCEYCRSAEDGLAEPWDIEFEGTSVFVNPPYGRYIKKWAEKCYTEAANGNANLVVALLPVATDTKWWQAWVARATEVRFLKGRVKFTHPTKELGPATFASAIVVWRRGQLGWHRVSYWDWRHELPEEAAN